MERTNGIRRPWCFIWREANQTNEQENQKNFARYEGNALDDVLRMWTKLFDQLLAVSQLVVVYPMRDFHPPRKIRVVQPPVVVFHRDRARTWKENIDNANEKQDGDEDISRVTRHGETRRGLPVPNVVAACVISEFTFSRCGYSLVVTQRNLDEEKGQKT
jgi:hypothetical protein